MQNGDEAMSINSQAYMQGWSDITSLAGWSAAPSKTKSRGGYKVSAYGDGENLQRGVLFAYFTGLFNFT